MAITCGCFFFFFPPPFFCCYQSLNFFWRCCEGKNCLLSNFLLFFMFVFPFFYPLLPFSPEPKYFFSYALHKKVKNTQRVSTLVPTQRKPPLRTRFSFGMLHIFCPLLSLHQSTPIYPPTLWPVASARMSPRMRPRPFLNFFQRAKKNTPVPWLDYPTLGVALRSVRCFFRTINLTL